MSGRKPRTLTLELLTKWLSLCVEKELGNLFTASVAWTERKQGRVKVRLGDENYIITVRKEQ